MKTLVRKDTSKFITKKRVLLMNSLILTVIAIILAAGCSKIDKDSPVRLVFPVLTTDTLLTVTSTSVVGGGNITSDGGYAITARGVCWGSSANPSTLYPDSTTLDGTGSGQFASTASGLASNKTYHIRAYATNSQGTSYGLDVSFTSLAK
jgi:hypothetical protein